MALLGNIKAGTLPNLLRALGLRRATATLVCENGPLRRALVHLAEGRLIRVAADNLVGEDALSDLFKWREGYYYLIKGRIEENLNLYNFPSALSDTRKHILVVDDDAQATALIERYLEKEGYRVSIAFEGKHALDLIVNVKPDLVLLDVMLPGMNGLDVARRLRERAITEKIPIVIMSAIVGELPEGYRQWNFPFLAKPFGARQLTETIKLELGRPPAAPPEFAIPAFDSSISGELIDLLLTDLPLPPADTVYAKSEALEIRLALGNFSEETIRLFDLFDGTRSLRDITAQFPSVASKITFLVVHMAAFGLLERVEPMPTASGKTTQLVLSQFEGMNEVQEQPIAAAATASDLPVVKEGSHDVLSPPEIERLAAGLKHRYGTGGCAKLVVFGLVGRVQTAFTESLRALAQVCEGQLSAPIAFHLPPVPGVEVARISLAPDLGLFVYQLTIDSELPRLVRLIGGDIWAAIFVTDTRNRFEIDYTRYLLQSVGEAFNLPNLVAVPPDGDVAALAEHLVLPSERVVSLDVASPNSILSALRRLMDAG